MSREIRIELSEGQHERLSEIKDRRGYTWKGLILEGSDALDDGTVGPEYVGLTQDEDKDQRVYPDPDDDRLGSFKTGWTKAVKGESIGRNALEGLSWHNLGWRLGMIFGETPDELRDEIYQWCVEQQRETSDE